MHENTSNLLIYQPIRWAKVLIGNCGPTSTGEASCVTVKCVWSLMMPGPGDRLATRLSALKTPGVVCPMAEWPFRPGFLSRSKLRERRLRTCRLDPICVVACSNSARVKKRRRAKVAQNSCGQRSPKTYSVASLQPQPLRKPRFAIGWDLPSGEAIHAARTAR